MAQEEAEVVGAVETFTDVPDEVTDTDDGGAIVRIGDDEGSRPNKEWYENIKDDFDDETLSAICTRLLQDVERDGKAREKREKDYEESIKRTGLGKETPGGADFEGASKAVHPMLTEAVVDFQSRAIKELMPPNGPVKTYIPGESPEVDRFKKGERIKNYMNWQFLKQMPDFRTELEQLLSQTPLGGSQYLRLVYDAKKKRPVPTRPADEAMVIRVFETISPTTNAISKMLPVSADVAPAAAARSSAWLPVSAPMPCTTPIDTDAPEPYSRRRPVSGDFPLAAAGFPRSLR